MTFEELKQQFINNGFQIEGDSFIGIKEDLNTTINGFHPKKKFEMKYICSGYIKDITDSSDSDYIEEDIYQFDIIDKNKEPFVTICISDFNDFINLVGWE